MNLFDLMRGAGDGDAFAALAKQYGLSDAQVAKAVEAFLPALSAGLKRSTADPLGLMEFMGKLATTDYRQAYLRPEWAFGPGRREGDDALAFLFGSPAAARALMEQASRFTGLAQEKLKEMFPALAAIMFGGLAENAAAANPMLDAMLKQFRASASPAAAAKGPLDRYEEQQEARDRAASTDAARLQEQMMQTGPAAFQAGTAAWQEAATNMLKNVGGGAVTGDAKRPETEPSGRDVFGEMFEPGRRLSEAYQREVEALLDRLKPATSRSRGPS